MDQILLNKEFQSHFLPDLKVDLSNYITELLICNYLKWQKQPIPNSPFWRKGITVNSEHLKELGKRYGVELSAVKDLLEVFTGSTIIKYFRENNTVGIKFVKKETQQRIIYELFKLELKFKKENKCIKDRVTIVDSALPFTGTGNVTTGITNKLGTL